LGNIQPNLLIKGCLQVQSLSGLGKEFGRHGRPVKVGSLCGWCRTTDAGLQIALPDVVSLIQEDALYVIKMTKL
jgi:hypothetical protein